MIVAVVIVSPIAILLPVCLIMFLIETNAVAQGETIVRGDQINRRRRRSTVTLKNVAGCGKTLSEVAQRDVLLQPESTRGIAEMVVPLGEQRRKVTHLVAARADIPGFRDQLDLRQTRVVTDGLKQRRILTKRRRPPHHRGEVETKAVNVALVNPKAQALAGILHHAGVAEVEGVPAAGPVVVIAVFPDPIIATVIDSAQGEGRPFQVYLRAMVQHHVKDHFDARRVQRFYRIAKLV